MAALLRLQRNSAYLQEVQEMTCGECKHLKKAKHPRYSHICMAPLPAWTLHLIYEDSYLTPDAVFDNCPCFVAKEGQ